MGFAHFLHSITYNSTRNDGGNILRASFLNYHENILLHFDFDERLVQFRLGFDHVLNLPLSGFKLGRNSSDEKILKSGEIKTYAHPIRLYVFNSKNDHHNENRFHALKCLFND